MNILTFTVMMDYRANRRVAVAVTVGGLGKDIAAYYETSTVLSSMQPSAEDVAESGVKMTGDEFEAVATNYLPDWEALKSKGWYYRH